VATVDLRRLFPAAADGSRAPLPKQQEFLKYALDPKGPQFVAYYGGFGSGKSVVLCTAIITQAVLYGGDYLISRHFMPELRRTTMKTFLEMCPKELISEVRVADAEVHLKSTNGIAVVYFIGLDEPGKIDSMNLSGFAIDEASQTTQEAFLKLQGRLRNPKGLRKGLLVGNPKGRDHVYRYFVSKVEQKATPTRTLEEAKANYKMIVAPSTENIHLAADYIENMLSSYSKERIQRYVMGSFDSFEGMIYDDFSRQIHVVEPFDIPSGWTRIVGADHGFTNPAAFLFGAVDHDGNIVIYHEFYKSEWIIKDICHGKSGEPGINKFITKEPRVDAIYIDPSTKATRGQTGVSDFSTYLEHLPNHVALVLANNDVSSGIDRVKSFLRVNPKTKKPRLTIFSTCTNLIEEIGEYRWAELSASQEGSKNRKEEPRKYNDHACDALRYLIMSRPDPAKLIKHDKSFPSMESSIQKELESIRKPKEKDPFGDY
jgi:phage terminase large subunit